MILYQSQMIFMFSCHDSLSNDLHVSLYVLLYVSLYVFLYVSLYVFLYVSLYVFLYVSLYVFLYVSLYVFLYVSLYVFLHVSLYDFLSNNLYVFSSWLFIKKIMQKDNAKVNFFFIFSFLDVKLKFLINWVELTQFSVESSCIKLKICLIQLKLNWKCKQLDFELSWIQNVNLKLNLMISLFLMNSSTLINLFWA